MIEEYREKIDGIDREIARLFEERMKCSSAIGEYKTANGIPIVNREREAQVIEQGLEYLKDAPSDVKAAYRPFMAKLMELSVGIQEKHKAEQSGNTYISCSDGGYGIYIGNGYLDRAGEFFNLDRRVLIVTDGGEAMQYASKISGQCKLSATVAIEPGERGKSFQSVERLCHYMLSCGMDRHDCVVAVGGGVVGDVAGLAASLYMRGIDFYNIPTTVLSMVDSSIGGKTAVNLHGVKNIVGAFKTPKGVLIDTETLKTLPERHISNGLAEAVKMSLTCDAELFERFEALENPMDEIDCIIRRSLEIKKSVVECDEFESGLRRVLNFGHTLGHGIESNSEMLHGECVALGMLPMCSDEVKRRLTAVFVKLKLPTTAEFDLQSAAEAVMHDKKSNGDLITCVTVPEPGRFEFEKKDLSQLVTMLASLKE